ncbi:hypothetical protein WA158_006399 [Blastocystis sp. Blastoise]
MPISIESKLGEKAAFLKPEEIEELNKVDGVVVISGAPVVDAAKATKLRIFFLRLLKDFPVVNNDVFIPLNPKTGESSGIIFVELVDATAVPKLIAKFNNYKMDKAHTLSVYSFKDLDESRHINEDSIEEPKEESYEPLLNCMKRPTSLWNWISDDLGREQFVIRHTLETGIYHTEITTPSLEYGGEREKSEGKNWCESRVQWSPQGTYLATFHKQGIVLWGGDKWEKLCRFVHDGVREVLFSPKENYLITWNGTTGMNNTDAVCVWDVHSGKVLRKFACADAQWPMYKFSYDEKYIATKGKDSLDRKVIPAVGIQSFDWSPVENMLIYWSPESNNKPASMYALEIPYKQIRQSVSATNVTKIEWKWQNKGKYLAALLSRSSKNKKRVINQFSIFRMSERYIPVETCIINDETILDYDFEGNGSKFAIIHSQKEPKNQIDIYDLESNKTTKEMSLLYSLTDKSYNHIYWCPLGRMIILAGLGNPYGSHLEWFDADSRETVSEADHFMCTDVYWDCSGRYVASCVREKTESLKYTLENGYNLWDINGTQLYKAQLPHFLSFEWRPYPDLNLTKEQIEDVKKNLKKFIPRYKNIRKEYEQLSHITETRRKLALIDEFKKRREALRPVLEDIANKRRALGIPEDTEDNYVLQSNVTETIISTKEEVVKK